MSPRLYPDLPAPRTAAIARDVAAVLLVVLFAWLAHAVHDAVAGLADIGRGVQDAGQSVQGGFGSAASAVKGVPIVGGDVADALRSAGSSTGGRAVVLGRQGEQDALDLANLLGWLVFLIPTGLLLALHVPRRVHQIRALNAAAAVLANPGHPGRRAAIASRAAYGLPYSTLLRYTPDPLGDLQAGRFEPLVAAAAEEAGLDPRLLDAPGGAARR